MRLKQARMQSKSDLPSGPQMTPSPSIMTERTGEGQECLGNGVKLLAPVVATTGEHAHPLALTDGQEPKAIVFDLIGPLRPSRHPCANRTCAGSTGCMAAFFLSED